MIKYEKARKDIINTGLKMVNNHMTAGTWGNISARVEGEELMAITPSGVAYDMINIEDIIIMDFDGNVIDGHLKPSIEFSMHALILKYRKDINAVVHTHSEYATSFAIVRKPIPPCVEDMVQIVGGEVKVSEYFLPGTKELGIAVLDALEHRNAALLASHGCVSLGTTLDEALKTSIIVEKAAKQIIFAKMIGEPIELCVEDVNYMRDFYLNSYGQK